jgi:hypothetical protein
VVNCRDRLAPRKWIARLFSGACETGVSPATSRDGFTVVRKTNDDPPWTKIGAAFPHKEGLGFSIELKAFPLDGRLVALPPDTDD